MYKIANIIFVFYKMINYILIIIYNRYSTQSAYIFEKKSYYLFRRVFENLVEKKHKASVKNIDHYKFFSEITTKMCGFFFFFCKLRVK
jgi:hypothetical protein